LSYNADIHGKVIVKLCVALKQTKMSLLKNGRQEGKTHPVWGLVKWEGGGYNERVWKDECCGNIILMYANGKIRLVELKLF
jgi:hypothetical protein